MLACLGRQHGGRAAGLVCQGSRQHRRQEHGAWQYVSLYSNTPLQTDGAEQPLVCNQDSG
jgi:hypothetical protein